MTEYWCLSLSVRFLVNDDPLHTGCHLQVVRANLRVRLGDIVSVHQVSNVDTELGLGVALLSNSSSGRGPATQALEGSVVVQSVWHFRN